MFRTPQKDKIKMSSKDKKKFLITYFVIIVNLALFQSSQILDIDIFSGGFSIRLLYRCLISLLPYIVIAISLLSAIITAHVQKVRKKANEIDKNN